MFRNYCKLALRTLWRQKFYSALNIFGLSLGIAVGVILFQFIRYNLSFDRYHHNSDQLYRMVTELHLPDGSLVHDQGTPLPLAAAVKDVLPQINDAAALLKVRTATVGVPLDSQVKYFAENGTIAFTDRRWFDLFHYTWMKGNPRTALTAPHTAVITQQLAAKYFGKQDPIGKVLRIDDKHDITITGVLKDPPPNTDLKTALFLSRASFKYFYPEQEQEMNQYWGAIYSTTHSFVRLPEGMPIKKVEDAMARLVKEHFSADVAAAYQFHLQPLKDMHFDGRYGGTMRRSLLVALAFAGFFLVLIACFNFINLATAQSMKRAREIGTRKALGGTPAAICWQFMMEIAGIALLATALAFVWILLFLPVVNGWLQTELRLNLIHDPSLLLGIFLLLIFVVLASGIYPALILSRFKPVEALKQQRSGGRTAVYRKGLVIVQNVIVQALIICSLIITWQIRHLKTADLGFNKDTVLMVPIPAADKHRMSWLGNELRAQPGITAVSFCYQAPASTAGNGGSVKYDDRPWEKFSASTIMADAQYLATFQLKLLAGDNLQPSDTVRQALINQTFMHKLGFKDPQEVIGHRLVIGSLEDRVAIIAGVVKDFNVHSLYTPLDPVVITTKQDDYRYAAIKLAGNDHAALRDVIRKTWQSVYPANVFEYRYLDEQIDEFYHKEDLLSNLIRATTATAIVISCLGLLGLISFFTVQRTKEIGIRKVLGAGVTDIVYLLSKDFFILLLVSIVIAVPFVLYFMNHWLEGFAYRINISWWMFLLSGFLSVLIALFTVSFQAIKAAVADPVKSLKVE